MNETPAAAISGFQPTAATDSTDDMEYSIEAAAFRLSKTQTATNEAGTIEHWTGLSIRRLSFSLDPPHSCHARLTA